MYRVLLALLLFLPINAYATHISQPILTIEESVYYLGSKVRIEGFVEYQDRHTSDVLLNILINNEMRDSIRSDENGNFAFSFEPQESGIYLIKIISQCRDEHRSICTYKEAAIEVEVRDSMVAYDERLELQIVRIIKGSNDVEILLKNRSNERLDIDMKRFYIANDDIHLSNANGIVTLDPGEEEYIRLGFIGYNYDGRDPLLIYDDGISILRVPEFSLAMLILAASMIFYLMKRV